MNKFQHILSFFILIFVILICKFDIKYILSFVKCEFDITKDILSLFTAVFIVDFIFAVIIRYFLGNPINDWYDNFGISAVFADVFSIVIGIVLAYIIYTTFIKKENEEFNIWMFIGVTICVQLLHDLFFYYAIVKQMPKGHNKMIDVFREYGEYGGAGILAIDALMMVLSILIFCVISNYFNDVSKLFCFAFILYAFQYIIYTPRQNIKLFKE